MTLVAAILSLHIAGTPLPVDELRLCGGQVSEMMTQDIIIDAVKRLWLDGYDRDYYECGAPTILKLKPYRYPDNPGITTGFCFGNTGLCDRSFWQYES